MISLYVPKPTDLTTFPTLILVVTLFRLALNIATTRMILSQGYQGPDAVSDIITSFGQFVVGGNYVIGIIVFTILVLINFMVITKGSTRVAEVAARFTLDAMPGKQMAIDADLNAGLIDEATARERREVIIQEANFYGAMDGSSKFVKGDAIAGIIITIINIVGGFLIGMLEFDMSASDSAATFTILTIGDGLVSQLPALVLSTATGIIITRASKSDGGSFANSVVEQLFNDYKTLFIVGFILVIFALVPGLPTIALGFIGTVFLLIGYITYSSQQKPTLLDIDTDSVEDRQEQSGKTSKPTTAEEEEKTLESILKQDILELDLGYQLIKLADPSMHGDLLDRIKTTRRKVATDFGFIVPQIRIRDNLHLQPNNYQLLLKGVDIGHGEIFPDKFLAMDSGLAHGDIEGVKTKEPAFGLDAIWIEPSLKEEAITHGYTVVDPATVISTHIGELIKSYSSELLTRQDIANLLDNMKKSYLVVVEDVQKVASLGLIQKVLKELLSQKIPIKDMLTILETISDVAEVTKNVDILVEQVRAKLSRVISNMYSDDDKLLKLITFANSTEQKMIDKLQDRDGYKDLLLNISQINSLVNEVSIQATEILSKGIAPVILIVDPLLRKSLSDIFVKFNLDVVVLSHAEIDPSIKFEVLANIDIKDF
jgi:flagellar biosynthesis protein FlhA